jgi:hypothetical protein
MKQALLLGVFVMLTTQRCFGSDTPSFLSYTTGVECRETGKGLIQAFGLGSIDNKLLIYRGCEYSVVDFSSHVALPVLYVFLISLIAATLFWLVRRRSKFFKILRKFS